MFCISFKGSFRSTWEHKTNEILRKIDNRDYYSAITQCNEIKEQLSEIKSKSLNGEGKNEAFLLERFFTLLLVLAKFWNSIENESYYESWCFLQDCIDNLKIIKKFNTNNNKTLKHLEKQLKHIELIYPYKLFSSIGFIAEGYTCSICGLETSDDDCPHIQGELYAGEIAYSIGTKIKDIDHVAIVETPENKRLVLNMSNDLPEFYIFRLLVDDFKSKKITPLGFSHLIVTYFDTPDNDWMKLPRNSICFCGSGKKFKKCCIDKKNKKRMHVDFLGHKLIE